MEKQKVKVEAQLLDWDRTGDGISKGAFRLHLLKLGLDDAEPEDADALYDQYDVEHSGALDVPTIKQGFRRVRNVTQNRFFADERRSEAASRLEEVRGRIATAKEAYAIATKADACDEELSALVGAFARSIEMQLGELLVRRGEKLGELIRTWPKPKSRSAEQLKLRAECAHDISRDEFKDQLQLLGLKVGAEPDAAGRASAAAAHASARLKSARTARKKLAKPGVVYRAVSRAELGRLFDAMPQHNTGWLTAKELKRGLMEHIVSSRAALNEQYAKEKEGRTTRVKASSLLQAALKPIDAEGHAAGTVYA